MPSAFTRGQWAVGVAAGLACVAMVLYPGGTTLDPTSRGYVVYHNFLSDLGMTVAYDGRPNGAGASLFVAALLILVVALGLCLPEFLRLYSAPRSQMFARVAVVIGAVVAASFVGVALTPENSMMGPHLQFTLFAFRVFPAVALFLGLASFFDDSIPRGMTVGWLALTAVLVVYVAVLDFGPRLNTTNGLTVQVVAQKIVAALAVGMLFYQCRAAEHVSARRARGAPSAQ